MVFAVFGFLFATYFATVKLTNIFAANDTYKTWTFNSADSSNYTYSAGDITVDDSGARIPNKILNSTFDTDLTSWSEVPSYTLNDQFTTNRAAGAVHGTSAEPTGGTRTVVDTNSKISIASGLLTFTTGEATFDGILYPVVTRSAGQLLVGNINITSGTLGFGWDNNTSGDIIEYLRTSGSDLTLSGTGPTAQIVVGTYTTSTGYKVASVMRGTGMYWFIKGGTEYPNWTLMYTFGAGTSNLYPVIQSRSNLVATFDNIRIPTALWLPTPLAYDTFTRADGAIGSSETTGPDGQTTPSLSWTGGAISSNRNVITPSLGSEMWDAPAAAFTSGTYNWVAQGTNTINNVNNALELTFGNSNEGGLNYFKNTSDLSSDLTVGTWYAYTEDIKVNLGSVGRYIWGGTGVDSIPQQITSTSFVPAYMSFRSKHATSGYISATALSTGEVLTIDNTSLKPLTLSSLFSSVSTSDADVIADANVTLTAGTQAGLVLNLDSTSSPANFVIAYHDGTNVRLEKAVAGVYTSLINTAATYSAGATLRVIKDGTKYRVYYNNALVGAEQTISDAGIISNTRHGLFSTFSGNNLDNFTLWPRGSGTTKFTDAPFEELTPTRDTTIKYAGVASAKLVAGGTDANYLQSLNVGDGSSYMISGYAYSTGAAITSADLSIHFDGSTQSTTYADMGSGWYKLTASVTGANSAKNFGVRVKAGKTVYLDSFGVVKTTNQAVFNTSGYYNANVSRWDSFASSETTPTGTSVRYQICTDDGSTCESGGSWKYYTGGVWTTASNITSHFNTAGELTPTAMQALPVTTTKISVKTILITDGVAIPSIASITIGLTTDVTAPVTNASSLAMTKTNGGASITSNGWTNDLSPYFSWTAGADNVGGSGLRGYCLYVGTDSTGDPSTAKGLLGTSPVSTTGSACQFIVSSTSINLATLAHRGNPWLTTSSSSYYLNIKAVDNAGNVFPTLTSFRFNYDGAVPTNVSYISCASGNFSNVADMNFSWPIAGSAAATDANSAISGWQYQINSTSGTWNSLTGSSRTLTSGTDGSSIVSGNNIVYFRSVDTPGNLSSDATIRTCNLAYGGAAPQFGGTDTVTVTPATSTSNSYALSWPAATATVGQTVAKYYYMINTSPPSTLATLQGNASTYVDNGTTRTVSAAALANVNKGTNTVYVVAIDNAGTPNYSPSNYISGTFTLNSTDPDNVGSLVGSDSSIKSSSQWNVTLTWVAPTYQGAGNLTYLIKRSTDNVTFTQVGTASGLSYVDSAPSSAKYYYKVYTKDGANAQSSGTNAVSITPTGKWTSAPSLDTGPTAGSITTKKATITWSTSRSSDSKISYGTTSGGSYGDVEPSNSSQVASHSIQLTGLNPGTTYYYKAKWTDEDGNTGTSDEKSFSTGSAPTVKDTSAKSIGLTTATIQYTSQNASKVKIYYGTTTSFGGIKEVSTSTSETTYTTELSGLTDGTKYYYKINTFDSESSEYEGTILDFTTLPRPKISSVRIQEVKGTAQPTILVSWTSNTEVSSIVTYYPEGKASDARDEVNISLTKGEHKLFLKGLFPQTNYYLIVKGRDKIGNEAVSDTQKVTTATDTRPPQILNVKIEGGVIPVVGSPGQESSAQLVVSWDTDEPSTSQVEFGEGTGETYSQKTQEDSNLTINHLIVISNLTPSKVYHLRAMAKDKAGNVGKSIDSVTITPKSTLSALDLVIGNLSEVFGFLGNIK